MSKKILIKHKEEDVLIGMLEIPIENVYRQDGSFRTGVMEIIKGYLDDGMSVHIESIK